jgi:hypothetical protein
VAATGKWPHYNAREIGGVFKMQNYDVLEFTGDTVAIPEWQEAD